MERLSRHTVQFSLTRQIEVMWSEYFNEDDGAGLGASHQTGWTGLVAKLIQQKGEKRARIS